MMDCQFIDEGSIPSTRTTLINSNMEHKPNSIFDAASKVLFEQNTPPPRITKEIHYKTKNGNERVSEVGEKSEAEEIKTIKALGGTILKVLTVKH